MEATPAPLPSTGAWGATPSPWGKVSAPAPCSLEDVMSEELAQQLQREEDGSMSVQEEPARFVTCDEINTSNDMKLAQMLQYEFDKEADKMLELKEEKYNGPSKVRMSFAKYRVADPGIEDYDTSSEDDGWDEEEKEDPSPQFKRSGICGKGKNIVTKHDPGLCGRKNAKDVFENMNIAAGDRGKVKDVRIPNNVYNKLKQHSQSDVKKSHRLHEKKEHSTADQAIDPKTRMVLYKLVNNDILSSVNGNISSGKESVVVHADGGSTMEFLVPEECAIKIFKTTITDFKNRSSYVKGDIRFFKDEFKKQNPRKIMKIWAAKEEFNLKRMEKAGIPCPKVVTLKKHVLVLSFIGRNHIPAPKLKDARLSSVDLQIAYEQCLANMKKMYRQCSLVHADLSPYNMLWHDDLVYFIDVGQGVDLTHPQAHEFLLRDCHNVSEFFNKSGVHDVMDEHQMFNEITGLGLEGQGSDFLSQIQQFEKSEERLRSGTGKEYAFDYFFDQSMKEREGRKDRLSEEEDSESSEDDNVADVDDEDKEVGAASSSQSSNPDQRGIDAKTSAEVTSDKTSPGHTHYVIEKFGDIGDD